MWLAELARLLPELHERYPDLTRVVEDASVARNHLFEAVARLLTVLAARTPLILFLDDLHWADTATLDLLHYLVRHFTERATPLLLLLCVRTEARQMSSELAEWRANVGRIVPLTRLQLNPLTMQDTISLLSLLARSNLEGETHKPKAPTLAMQEPTDVLEQVGQQLFAETRGQPFYLIETLKLLLAHGLFPSSSDEDVAVAVVKQLGTAQLFPPSVRELISIQLDRLRPAAFAFLVAGAVLEQDATFERLCGVADLSEQEGLVALDEVLWSLLVPEPKRLGGLTERIVYTFTHPMIRDVVSVEAGETRSRVFHRRALHLLQDTSVPTARLAHHALAAGMLAPAFRLSVAAGDEAREVFAFHVAIEHYEQAWQLLAPQRMDSLKQANIGYDDVSHLYVALGYAYELTRAWEQARPLANAMLTYLLQMVEQEDEASKRTKTLWYQAMLALSTAERATALPYGERALAVARSSGYPELIVQSLNALAFVTMQTGEWEEYEHHATEVLAYYVSLHDRAMEADALCMLAQAHLHRGQLHMGITHARRAFRISQEIRNTWGEVNALYDLTSGLLDSGAYTEALSSALQAAASARTLNRSSARASTLLLRALIQLGGVYRAMQAATAAHIVDLEALRLNETHTSSSYTTVITSVLCADATLLGEWADAGRYARQATKGAGEHELVYVEFPYWCVTEALLYEGDAVQARAYLARLNAHTRAGRRDRVQYLWASARLAVWEGRQEQARSDLDAARVLAEEIGLSDERWQIQVALGDLNQSQGEAVQAERAYAQAMSLVQALAERIEDKALRTNFLTAPRVQHILEYATP